MDYKFLLKLSRGEICVASLKAPLWMVWVWVVKNSRPHCEWCEFGQVFNNNKGGWNFLCLISIDSPTRLARRRINCFKSEILEKPLSVRHWYLNICCVFWPAKGCFARRSLVEINFLTIKQLFARFYFIYLHYFILKSTFYD